MNHNPSPEKTTPPTNQRLALSCKAQRQQVLDFLIKNLSITTLEARETLGVMALAPRVFELRRQWEIPLVWCDQTDIVGIKHKAGKYLWTGKRAQKSEAAPC